MNPIMLQTISIALAGLTVGSIFIPRFPSSLCAFAALLILYFTGLSPLTSTAIVYWAIATAIVLGLDFLQPRVLTATRRGHAYVAAATLAGTLLGVVASPTTAAAIIGGAAGAFLGAMAYMRTPASPRYPVASSQFVQYLCAKGLPAVVACSMAAIILVSQL